MQSSLPLRERGLKLMCATCVYVLSGSLPLRERGLKSLSEAAAGSRGGRSLYGSVD